MIVAMPKGRALQFTTERNLSAAPADGLQVLEQLVQQKQAESVANPSITTVPGKMVTSESATATLKAEPIVSNSGEIETSLELKYGSAKLSTDFTAPDKGVKFLGAFDSPDQGQNATCLAFIRVRADAPLTWTVNGIAVTHGDPALVEAAHALANLPQPVTVAELVQIFTEEGRGWVQSNQKVQAMNIDDPIRRMWEGLTGEDFRIGNLARVLAASRDPRAAVTLGNALDTADFPFFGKVGACEGLFDYFVQDLGYGLTPEKRSEIPGDTTNVLPYTEAAVRRWWAANKSRCEAEAAKISVQVR